MWMSSMLPVKKSTGVVGIKSNVGRLDPNSAWQENPHGSGETAWGQYSTPSLQQRNVRPIAPRK